jgi:hypothetical protein
MALAVKSPDLAVDLDGAALRCLKLKQLSNSGRRAAGNMHTEFQLSEAQVDRSERVPRGFERAAEAAVVVERPEPISVQ